MLRRMPILQHVSLPNTPVAHIVTQHVDQDLGISSTGVECVVPSSVILPNSANFVTVVGVVSTKPGAVTGTIEPVLRLRSSADLTVLN